MAPGRRDAADQVVAAISVAAVASRVTAGTAADIIRAGRAAATAVSEQLALAEG